MSAPAPIPRLVQVGLNLIGVLDINDKTHSWQGIVLLVGFSVSAFTLSR